MGREGFSCVGILFWDVEVMVRAEGIEWMFIIYRCWFLGY